MRFRSPHSRTDSSLAVQCQLRYTTKPRKSRVNSHYRNDKYTSNISVLSRGGEGGIRTHGTVTRTTVFETVPFDLSGTSPSGAHVACYQAHGNPKGLKYLG